jgi:hypothetical protein
LVELLKYIIGIVCDRAVFSCRYVVTRNPNWPGFHNSRPNSEINYPFISTTLSVVRKNETKYSLINFIHAFADTLGVLFFCEVDYILSSTTKMVVNVLVAAFSTYICDAFCMWFSGLTVLYEYSNEFTLLLKSASMFRDMLIIQQKQSVVFQTRDSSTAHIIISLGHGQRHFIELLVFFILKHFATR